jgi:hypothetical protein
MLPVAKLPGPLRFMRMAGSSIATPGAAPWVTDFLNGSFYARRDAERDVTDLRLAQGIITTRWSELGGKRLGARDVVALNAAFGKPRLARRGRLDRAALLEGSERLLGPWFPDAWNDDRRRAYGIAFPSEAERDAFIPEQRLRRAALGARTPPLREPSAQHWATYDPVRLPDPDGALALLSDPSRWPDIGCVAGRFIPLRSGGLLGQTFEIEVVAEPSPRSPIFTRGYVTCILAAVASEDRKRLGESVEELGRRYAAGAGADARPILPEGAEPLALVILETHAGHFLGPAHSNLLVWKDADSSAWIRDVGVWDPLAPYLAATYDLAGRRAQHVFWGPEPAERSMLAQLALVSQAQ